MTISEAIAVCEKYGLKVEEDPYKKGMYVIHLLTKTLKGDNITSLTDAEGILHRAEKIGYQGGYFPYTRRVR
jgi:hypothetical protein